MTTTMTTTVTARMATTTRLRSRAASGFTLLELLAAIAIFGLMAVTVLVNLDRSTDLALASVRARELRLLAEHKLGEIAVFEKEMDLIFDNEDFDEDVYGERWEGWEWSLYIRDVVVFGTTNDEAADYLFGDPDEDTADEEPSEEEQARQGETQFLRELTLTVRAPGGDEFGASDDSVEIITFLPLANRAPAAPAAPTGGGN